MGGALKPQYNPEAEALLKKNVKVTIGELFGGWAKKAEDGATSLLGVGDMIRHAQSVSLGDFNRAIYDEVLGTIGVKMADSMPVGPVALNETRRLISAEYDKLLPQMTAQLDVPFLQTLGKIKRMAPGRLTPAQTDQLDDLIKTHVLRYFDNPTGTALGQTLKEADSILNDTASTFVSRGNAGEKVYGTAVSEVHKAFRELMRRHNPTQQPELRRIDAAWSRLKVLEKTLENPAVQGRGGVFTPKELLSGVKQATRNKRAFARGNAPLQKTAIEGVQTLSPKIGNPGTADRAVITTVLAAPGLLTSAPGTLGAAAVGMGAYTQPGQSLLRFLATQRSPGMLSAGQSFRNVAPYTGMLAAGVGVNIPQ
jgi:hypothetical protein